MRLTCSRISSYPRKPWLPSNHVEAVLYNPSVCTISRSNSLITTVSFILRGTCRIRTEQTLSTKITSKKRPKSHNISKIVDLVSNKSIKNQDSSIKSFHLNQIILSANHSTSERALTKINPILWGRIRNRYNFLRRNSLL